LSTHTLAMAICGAALWASLASHPALGEESNITDIGKKIFVSSGRWYQFQKDFSRGIYHLYAALVEDGGDLLDAPNLIVLDCKHSPPYITVHFPSYYSFSTFSNSDWLPETKVYARNESSTFKFTAELNRNEIYIDINEDSRSNLYDLLSSSSMELRFGPDSGDRVVLFIESNAASAERALIEDPHSGLTLGKIVRVFDGWSKIAGCPATKR